MPPDLQSQKPLIIQTTQKSGTHQGHVRDNNEDSFAMNPELGLYMVADGMGGHNAGEVASQNAVSIIAESLSDAKGLIESLHRDSAQSDWDLLHDLVDQAINKACRALYDMGNADSNRKGMGTTLTLLLLMGDQGLMAHVGDSRLYLGRGGQIYQLSEDHTYVWQMLQKGKMSPEEARLSPFSHLLTRAVGQQPQVEVDLLMFDILPGDTLLLCSDGLHDYIEEPTRDLLPFLESDLETLPDRLIHWALEQGGQDNITTVAVRLQGETNARHQQVTLQFTTLQQTTLFRYITYEEMLRLLNLVEVETVEPGCYIVQEGEQGQELYVLLSGDVEITKDEQVLRELGPGAHFGEMALVNRAPRSASVSAINQCRLMVISEEGLYSLMRNEPRIANKILWGFVEVLSSRLRQNSEALAHLLRENEMLRNHVDEDPS